MRGGRWQHLSSEAHAPRRFLSEIGEDTRAALQGSPCVTVTPCRCVSDDISLERRKFCCHRSTKIVLREWTTMNAHIRPLPFTQGHGCSFSKITFCD